MSNIFILFKMAEVECSRVAGMSQRQRDEYHRTLPSTVPARKIRVRPVSAANVGVPCHLWNSLVATVTICERSFLLGTFLPTLANYPRSTIHFTLQFICRTMAFFCPNSFVDFFLDQETVPWILLNAKTQYNRLFNFFFSLSFWNGDAVKVKLE